MIAVGGFFRPRSTVTIEFSGDKRLALPKVGKRQETLRPGLNEIPVDYFHAIGADPDTAALIVAGVIKAVCVEHDFRDDETHCRNCGHNRESAAAAAAAKLSAPHDSKEG
jgi:hypothetical protein